LEGFTEWGGMSGGIDLVWECGVVGCGLKVMGCYVVWLDDEITGGWGFVRTGDLLYGWVTCVVWWAMLNFGGGEVCAWGWLGGRSGVDGLGGQGVLECKIVI